MAEILEKLRPDRDLQCYFSRPSAVAALSQTSAAGFTASGTWREQFDWAVIEWNRDNVFEHPVLRYLPDGDLSGLQLRYDETRTNCIPMDSDLFATADWPTLRVWASDDQGVEDIYKVPLAAHAAPIEGAYQPAYVDLTLQGTPTAGDYVGFAFLGEHYTFQLRAGDPLETALQAMVDAVNAVSPGMIASRTGTTVRLYYVGSQNGVKANLASSTTGANGNRIGICTYVQGVSEYWDAPSRSFQNGASPTKWRVSLDFSSLSDPEKNVTVPTNHVRKLRWTYSAELQNGAFQRSEFAVVVSNWTVTGNNRAYSVAGPGSQRVEDNSRVLSYSDGWTSTKGNFSGGTIHYSTTSGSTVSFRYQMAQPHRLYLGTRLAFNGAQVTVMVDGQPALADNLQLAGDDVLARRLVGEFPAGEHTVAISHAGPDGSYFYFDFLEAALPTTDLPAPPPQPVLTLATDWDTDHSIALAPERTAWILQKLGFQGRANHYVGALWFYELVRTGHQYASATVTFTGTPAANEITEIVLGRTDQPPEATNTIQHLNLTGDTPETIAKSFELELNRGYTAVRAAAVGNQLNIYSRSMGADGNKITITASPASGSFAAVASGATLAGGVDGDWRTDLGASPRMNRAARDWCRAYFGALKSYGIDVAASFSMELQNGDPSPEAGIAQCGPAGDPILLPTPALQTNFSPQSIAFWQQVYAEAASLQKDAGLQPFLQFGEVQWWYLPTDGLGRVFSGMPFYDDYTKSSFRAAYGRDPGIISSNAADPAAFPQEAAFLPTLIASFTDQIMTYVKNLFPDCRFEVLYPTDVNNTPFNAAVNYPSAEWTMSKLTCLKTESFGFTLNRNLNQSRTTIGFGNFPPSQRSHLVGIGDSTTAWLKEVRMAQAAGFESVVLFALDQFCLIGYTIPLPASLRRSLFVG